MTEISHTSAEKEIVKQTHKFTNMFAWNLQHADRSIEKKLRDLRKNVKGKNLPSSLNCRHLYVINTNAYNSFF